MIRAKIEPIDRWVEATISEVLSPEARSRALAEFARQAHREAQSTNARALGAEPPFEQFVDGRVGAALETVRPDGRIVFEFELINDVLAWIMAALIERSPRRSGAYRAGHRLFADGREVDPAGQVPPADEYSFTNYLPYTRKLEIGKTRGGRDFLVSVPNRIYERTAADAKARFGNAARIGFTFRGIVGGAQVNQAKAASAGQSWWLGDGTARPASGVLESEIGKRHGKTTHNRSGLRFPTITIASR
jgi:hypothetical protein